MTTILKENKDLRIKWKDFIFPLSIKDFSLKESAKIATYEYAGRNGAEHERVLNYRVFNLSGEFIPGVDKNRTVSQLIYDLRITNDNKPGIFYHPDIGSYRCIMSNLTIGQNGDGYSTIPPENSGVRDDGVYIDNAITKANISEEKLYNSYTFSIELYEHTPPNAKTFKEKHNELFPKNTVKPVSDIYFTKLIYKNSDELFNAIIENKILPGVNPVINAEWLRYDFNMREEAYLRWKAIGFATGSDAIGEVSSTTTSSTINNTDYTVKAGDTGIKIAKNFKISFTKIFEANRGVTVRKISKGTEGLYWKTASLIYPGDIIIIPNE